MFGEPGHSRGLVKALASGLDWEKYMYASCSVENWCLGGSEGESPFINCLDFNKSLASEPSPDSSNHPVFNRAYASPFRPRWQSCVVHGITDKSVTPFPRGG